jgi:uncharacterized protein (DUF4415 family)
MTAARKFRLIRAVKRSALRSRRRPSNGGLWISLPIDDDVVAAFQIRGGGWKAKINAALRKAAGLK